MGALCPEREASKFVEGVVGIKRMASQFMNGQIGDDLTRISLGGGADKPLFGTGGLIANINAATTRLTLIPQSGATIYYEFGSASSTASAVVPASGIDLPFTAATTTQWHFSGSGNLQVIQSG